MAFVLIDQKKAAEAALQQGVVTGLDGVGRAARRGAGPGGGRAAACSRSARSVASAAACSARVNPRTELVEGGRGQFSLRYTARRP
jgi:hypothetical protein